MKMAKQKEAKKEKPKERLKVLNIDISGREGLLPSFLKTAGHFGQELGKQVGRIKIPMVHQETHPELKVPELGHEEPEKPAFAVQFHGNPQVVWLRQLCSPEKIRLIQAIRHEKPVSIYDLAKKLGRQFKSVRQDLEILRRFGIVSFVKEAPKGKIGESKRHRLKPVLIADKLQVNIQI
ncbi:hypothetical protein COS75_01145 [Candidatus Pacearchaeota archaeon CG06_land_8_20_14_3_00_35_12]|nr:MAG: hypothetical protein COS75_01145 [Candidatus Pacearchaeota archaeon CG06_land_8_20_14_3_00_35_12]